MRASTVAPEYNQHYLHQPEVLHSAEQAAELLSQTYVNVLQAAEEEGLQALAVPALSVGVGKYPAPEAAAIAAGTCLKHAGGSLRYLEFVLLERYVYGAWQSEVDARLGLPCQQF